MARRKTASLHKGMPHNALKRVRTPQLIIGSQGGAPVTASPCARPPTRKYTGTVVTYREPRCVAHARVAVALPDDKRRSVREGRATLAEWCRRSARRRQYALLGYAKRKQCQSQMRNLVAATIVRFTTRE